VQLVFLVKKELCFFFVKEKKQVFRDLNTEGCKVVLFFAGKKTKKRFCSQSCLVFRMHRRLLFGAIGFFGKKGIVLFYSQGKKVSF
jgi:hypothetical protein